MANQVFVATESGSCDIKGDSIVFIKGVTMIDEAHPLLKACPDYFTPVEENHNFNATTIVHHDDGSGAPAWETEGDEYGHGTGADATSDVITALVEEHGIDLADVEGTGPDGEITLADVEAHVAGDDSDEDDDSDDPAHPDVNATEHAIALAAEHGIDLSTVTGTGTDDKILKSDVQKLVP